MGFYKKSRNIFDLPKSRIIRDEFDFQYILVVGQVDPYLVGSKMKEIETAVLFTYKNRFSYIRY